MLRKILGVAIALAVPALLAAQAPHAPISAAPRLAPPHVMATQVQGEVLRVDVPSAANQEVAEVEGQNDDGDVENGHADNGDVENGEVDQEGVDEPDGLNNDVNAGDQVEQEGDHQDEDTPPAPPAGTAQLNRIGRHRP